MDDPFADDMAQEAPAPPKKRSLFSSAVMAKAAAPADAVELFSRAKELESRFLADEERKRQKRLMKLERKRSSTSAENKDSTPPEEKRRRVSAHGKGDGYSSDESQTHDLENSSRVRRQSSHSSPGSRRSRQGSDPHPQASPTSLSARYSRDLHTRKPHSPASAKTAGCVVLSDSEDEAPKRATLPVRKPTNQTVTLVDSDDEILRPLEPLKTIVVEDENQFSDEEYPELVAAAKERARLKAEEASRKKKAFGEKNHTSQDSAAQGLDDIFETGSGPVDQDPKIEILITSKMEGTEPLKVMRRLSQKLQEVRLAWCDRQTIDGQPAGPQFKELLFLTYKGIRVFDFTTIAGLGFKVDSLGHLISGRDGVDSDGKIHLEAWTPDAFDVYKKRESAKKQQELGLDDDVVEEPKEPPAKKIKLILKSKDLPEYKLQVKPTTTIERIIEAFRVTNDLPEEKVITLHFDGEKLEDSDEVGGTELDDMDTVEVHIQ